MHRPRYLSILGALLLSGAIGLAPARAQPASVSLSVGDARFGELAEMVVGEIERLLGPPGDLWQLAPTQPGDSDGHEGDVIAVRIGAAPVSDPATSGAAAQSTIRAEVIQVDAVGWLESDQADAPRRIVSRGSLADAVRSDFAQVRDLLAFQGDSGGVPILVPIEPWLAPARSTIAGAATDLGLSIEWLDVDTASRSIGLPSS